MIDDVLYFLTFLGLKMPNEWSLIVDILAFIVFFLLILRYSVKTFLLWKKEGAIQVVNKAKHFFCRILNIPIQESYVERKKNLDHLLLEEEANKKSENTASPKEVEHTVKSYFHEQFPHLAPIGSFKLPSKKLRLNLVLNTLDRSCFFGDIAHSIALAVLFANKFKISLRIITRCSQNNPKDFTALLNLLKIPKPKKLEFYSDFDCKFDKNGFKLDVSENDIFLCTSWCTSNAVKDINFRDSFFI